MLFRLLIFAAAVFFVAQHFRFDHFASILFALSSIFFSLFLECLSRYQRRVGVGEAGERAVEKLLNDLHIETLHDIYLPTGRGSTQIDHVALFPGSIAVIETKTFNGLLELYSDRAWRRVGGSGKRYPIDNPLNQVSYARNVVAHHLPDARVWGIVVLAGKYRALGGHPPNVFSLDDLRNYVMRHRLKHGEWQYSQDILNNWARLKFLKDENAGFAKTHVRAARKRRGERFSNFAETWPLWLWGSFTVGILILILLARFELS